MGEEQIMENINNIRWLLNFHERVSLYSICQNISSIGDDEWHTARQVCNRLKTSGIFPFDISVTNADLFRQIIEFIDKSLKQ